MVVRDNTQGTTDSRYSRVDLGWNFLTMRVIKHRNKPAREVVEYPSMEILKSRLHRCLAEMV